MSFNPTTTPAVSPVAKHHIVVSARDLSKDYRIRIGPPVSLRDVLGQPLQYLSRHRQTRWRDHHALAQLNVDIHHGERVALLGANGAGKSTFLRILCRIVPPSSGAVCVRGRIAGLLEVGTGFHPELTGRENVWLGGAILGMSRQAISERFAQMVTFSGIGDFLDTPVKHYSSGMYVRLAFAVAAHVDTQILVIDEVLAVGDEAFREQCLNHMCGANIAERTLIFVSHDMEAVRRVATRALVFAQGRVVFDGAVADGIAFLHQHHAVCES
jgi:lipopolysaccharide transport system ATP-binding protein